MIKIFINPISIVLALAVPFFACSKIFTGPSIDADWVYSRVYYFCENGETSSTIIYPGDSLNIQSARITFSNPRRGDNTFHMFINDELISTQRFKNVRQSDGVQYSVVSDESTVFTYSENPEDVKSEFVFARWSESGSPLNGYFFSFQFPFCEKRNQPCDTLVVNFFKQSN